ncbi:MAG: DUF2061 domain-containing protein [Proteobacteria bacterium]|nr:DUF2061 domain-containing protein [Pseudomonadota bacterium]
MSRIRAAAQRHMPTLAKTGSYYVIHICVAALVAYAVTGNLLASLTLSLLEPTVQAVAFFFHEKAWERALVRRGTAQARSSSSAPSASSATRSTSTLALKA